MSLIVIGLNHKTAAIEVREKLSIDEANLPSLITHLNSQEKIDSSVVISTCNRSEFYLETECQDSAIQSIFDWFKIKSSNMNDSLYVFKDNDAVKHLFRVTAGIDSLVLGETQITGQVKSAYDISNTKKKLSNQLDRMFQNSFRVAKQIRSKTDIGKNPVSVANSAVQLSQQIFGQLANQSVLVIGAGNTSELVIRYLNKHSTQQLTLCNRSISNGKKLSNELNTDFFPLEKLDNHLCQYDLIFTATSSPEPIIKYSSIKQAIKTRKHKPIVIIDLAIPRDTDIDVKKLDDVFYYTVDDLEKVITENLKSREKAAETAESIIESEVEVFNQWLKAQEHKQLITDFQEKTNQIKSNAINLAIQNIAKGHDVEEIIKTMANSLTNKLNHLPMKAITDIIQTGDIEKINFYKDLIHQNKESKGIKNDT